MTKTEAETAGKQLQAKMKNKGWQVRVWENQGWHYMIHSGNLHVLPCIQPGKYYAGLGDSPELLSWHRRRKKLIPAGTPSFWHKDEMCNDPNEAAKRQVQRARAFLDTLTLIVIDAESTLAFK